jgi:DNA-binding NarL/FixJ family response regulator
MRSSRQQGRPTLPDGGGGGIATSRFRFDCTDFFVLSIPGKPEASWKLTEAERTVLAAVVSGRSNREIARTRGTSPGTVANQVTAIMRKLGARSRTELGLFVSRHLSR